MFVFSSLNCKCLIVSVKIAYKKGSSEILCDDLIVEREKS